MLYIYIYTYIYMYILYIHIYINHIYWFLTEGSQYQK